MQASPSPPPLRKCCTAIKRLNNLPIPCPQPLPTTNVHPVRLCEPCNAHKGPTWTSQRTTVDRINLPTLGRVFRSSCLYCVVQKRGMPLSYPCMSGPMAGGRDLPQLLGGDCTRSPPLSKLQALEVLLGGLGVFK